MDSFDSDCGCAAAWPKRNKYWICDIQLLVSPFYRGKHGNLYDYRLDGAGACCNMPYFRRDWTGTVDQKKKPFRVDADIMILGVYFVIVFMAYVIFEIIPINYRPVLIEGRMEASYPSSTTLLVLSVMPALVEQIQRRLSGIRVKQIITIAAIAFSVFMVTGRLISGVHWFTDIVGGELLSAGLFKLYKAAVMLTLKER
jgi:undecaprenyl-diphosphatase